MVQKNLNTNAPNNPHIIIWFLCLGAKFAAIIPIIMALSAAMITSMIMIWIKTKEFSNNLINLTTNNLSLEKYNESVDPLRNICRIKTDCEFIIYNRENPVLNEAPIQ